MINYKTAKIQWLLLLLSAFVMALLFMPAIVSAEIQPGDVFREYIYAKPLAVNKGWRRFIEKDSATIEIMVADLEKAERAELAVFFSTGHIGTSDQAVRINNGVKRPLPQPETPGNPYCYFRRIHGRPALSIPLSELLAGVNKLTFFVDKQVCYGFKWPGWNVESVLLRVYYHASKPHPDGRIRSPQKGSAITDQMLVETVVKSKHPINCVDVVGHYYGYSFEGSGRYQDWHYGIDENAAMWGHIGAADKAPYNVSWDLTWIPDQNQPISLMARIQDCTGMCYMTPAIGDLRLVRNDRSVKMYRAYNVPESFKTRLSATMRCPLESIEENLGRATTAQLASIIFIGHLEGKFQTLIGLNDLKLYGYADMSDYEMPHFYPGLIPVPLGQLLQGRNTFYIFNSTRGHMSEVYWPGPALLVAYDLKRPQDVPRVAKPTYATYAGPGFDTEYFHYSASDSVSFAGRDRAHLLHSDQVGDFIEFSIYIPSAGEYEIWADYLKAVDHGICQLYVDGQPCAAPWDQYLAVEGGYRVPEEIKLGSATIKEPGEKKFRLQVTAKNPASQGYRLAIQYFFIKKMRPPGQ